MSSPAAAATAALSPLALAQQADPVVQGVMALLVLASLATWAVAIEKALRLRALSRDLRALRAASEGGASPPPPGSLAAEALRAGLAEARGGPDPGETAGEFRARVEGALRAVTGAALREGGRGLPLLATTASAGPFVGLLGTVWGILHSFAGIAASGDTSLAAVAPGIAEALFATALGLVAAIPATVFHNRAVARLSRLRQDGAAAAARLARRLTAPRRGGGVALAAE